MLYCHLCQWKIQSLYNSKSYLLFCQNSIQQAEVHRFLIYQERDFLQNLNEVSNLGLCSRILCYEKTPEITKGGHFFCNFLSVVNTLVKKISIINSQHLLLVSSHVLNLSVAFDANFLRSILFIPSKTLRKLSLLFFGGNVPT